jgi:hypothetical protein
MSTGQENIDINGLGSETAALDRAGQLLSAHLASAERVTASAAKEEP